MHSGSSGCETGAADFQIHGSQEWGGKGLGRQKMKHEKGFGCFMVPQNGVGRVWEGKQ